MRPDDGRLRVALEERFHLSQVDRLRVRLRERHVDVVVEDHDEARLGGELEDAVERGIREAGRLARDLGRDEFLVDAELADAGEDAGKRLQHAADVVDAVHVGRVEAGDHRVEARLFLLREGAIDGCDVRVGERVVVERRVALQVVRRREVAGIAVRPLLLQRDAEQRRSAHARPHDLQELTRLDALLDVVRQVEVRVVETVGRALSLRDGTRRQNGQQ